MFKSIKLFLIQLSSALCLFWVSSSVNAEDLNDPALIARGEYLAKAADCTACHTNPSHIDKPFAGGYVINLFVGNIVSSNITPSKKYGIGEYTLKDFDRALRQGIRRDGAHLYPAMPYTNYNGLTATDVKALYAYFMYAVKPVDHPTPPTRLPFPYNIRLAMYVWNWLFLNNKSTDLLKQQISDIEYGRYLVDTLGHCDACHTPRNFMLGEDNSRYLSGAFVGSWYAPNITADVISGLGGWTHTELIEFLRNGHAKGKAQAAGGMAEAVSHSLRHLSDHDLFSMANYLKHVRAIRNEGQTRTSFSFGDDPQSVSITELEPLARRDPLALSNSSSDNGQLLYEGACSSCHGIDGKGTADQFYPSLTHNTALGGVTANNLVAAILFGVDRQTNDYKVSMPAFKDELTDAQIAAISNYALQRFGNPQLHVDAQMVNEIRNGGKVPTLVRITGALKILAVVVIFAGLLAWIYLYRQRKSKIKS